jgi:hypothetical protein
VPTWEGSGSNTTWVPPGYFPGLYEICDKQDPTYTKTLMTFVMRYKALPSGATRRKAILFRAFLATPCAGDFNELFSGAAAITCLLYLVARAVLCG